MAVPAPVPTASAPVTVVEVTPVAVAVAEPPVVVVAQQQPVVMQPVMVQQPVMVTQVSPQIHYAKGVPAGPLVCPYCKATISTSINMSAGLLTWLICGGLCLIGCWPCAPIPFCVDSTKDTIHSCPACNVVLGSAPAM